MKHFQLPFEKKEGFSYAHADIEALPEYDKYLLSFHPERPRYLDYLTVFEKQEECLRNDRFGSCTIQVHRAELTGNGTTHRVMLIGQQSSPTSDFTRLQEIMKNPEEIALWNHGMPTPAAFQKAIEAIALAEQEKRIIITIIDTAGADPTEASEAGGIAWKIGRCMQSLAEASVPTLSVIINRGCSGGAIALSGCDGVLAMEYATYMVISPEACSSILFHTRQKAALAAELSRITAREGMELGIIDDLIPESGGPAHRFPDGALCSFRSGVLRWLEKLPPLSPDSVFNSRMERWKHIGRWEYIAEEEINTFEKQVRNLPETPDRNRFVPRHKGCRDSEGRLVVDPVLFSSLRRDNFRCDTCFHRYLRLTAHDYIALVLDEGSFLEHPETRHIVDSDILSFPGYAEKLRDARLRSGTATAFVTGNGRIDGRDVVFCASNFSFLGGSFSMSTGEKLRIAAGIALERQCPLIIHATGGGARMHEGCSSMTSIPKVHVSLSAVERAGLPLVTIISDPALGGVAIGAGSRGEHIIEHNAGNIGFSGKRVIEQYTGRPTSKGFQTADWLREKGYASRIARPSEMKREISAIISRQPSNSKQ